MTTMPPPPSRASPAPGPKHIEVTEGSGRLRPPARRFPSAAASAPVFALLAAAMLVPAPSTPFAPATVFALPLGAQDVELRWSFEPGEEYRYRQTQSNVTSTPMGVIETRQTSVLRKEVRDVDPDGVADVRVTFEAISALQESPTGRHEYDSERDGRPTDPALAALARLVGASFEMRLAPDGEIVEISGADELLERMLGALDGGGSPSPEMRTQLEALFGEEQLGALMRQGMHVLPADPVAPGIEWGGEVALALPFLGTVTTEYRYTLDEVAADGVSRRARIDVAGTGDLEPDPESPMAGMIEVSGGDFTGEMIFDVGRGLLLSSSVVSDMTVSAMGQTMRIETTQALELLEEGASR